MPATRLAALLLEWYSHNARDLPWRKSVSPYRIWVSEVMLQQTRVDAVIPYYRRWLKRFPSLKSLAAARERSVLALWEGLGYYSRARNLQMAAKIVVQEMGGRVPPDPDVFRRLPGVGEYTAAAVASIAFGRNIVALDANVRRVLARLSCMRLPVGSADGQARLRVFAAQHLPAGRAGDFNQGLMDLGALVCIPRKPRCESCPLGAVCVAHRHGLQNAVPARRQPRPRPHYHARAAAIVRGDRVLLVRRNKAGLLGGMWEFPKSSQGSRLPSQALMIRDLAAKPVGAQQLRILDGEALAVVDHTYSHFSITVHAYLCTARSSARRPEVKWVALHQLAQYPMGKVDRTIAKRLAVVLAPVWERGSQSAPAGAIG
jgi:A/G-specific adenine glycosylase